jgi:hypothetical protein
MEEHVDLMSDLVQKISSELRSNFRPAKDNFLGFFHAIDWKVPTLLPPILPQTFSFISIYLLFLVLYQLSSLIECGFFNFLFILVCEKLNELSLKCRNYCLVLCLFGLFVIH